MFAAKKQVVSKSGKTNRSTGHFEALESRQLLSASVTHATGNDVHVNQKGNGIIPTLTVIKSPVVTSPVVTTPIVTKPITSKPVVTSPILTPIHLPTFFVEPTANSSVTHWTDFSSDPLFAPGGPSPRDVVQGQVGDCWYLATLAEVADRDPSAIESSITQRTDGTYDVYFHNGSKIVDEHVDGSLPETAGNTLEYAQLGQDSCTWVAIMEKALTYFRNTTIAANYNTINTGWGREAFTDLGFTYNELLTSTMTASQMFSDVTLGLIFGASLDFGTSGTASGPLVNSHEYSVISVRVENGVDQIELRNPWGYNPNFSATSSNYDGTNDGYIWVNASSVLPELDEIVTASA